MHATIRPYDPQDEAAIVTLSLRAWAPVFASLESELGRDLFLRLHGDWREYQAGAVRDTLAADGMRTWVACAAERVVGFAAATLHEQREIGEIVMLAVNPSGADPGHAAARRVYAAADYTRLGVARYFKAL
jgi:ribosomal protein S18 acetylase RimI-like enzyme